MQAQAAKEDAEQDLEQMKRNNESLTARNTELQEKLDSVLKDVNDENLKRWRSFCSKQESPPGNAFRKRAFSSADVE